MATKLERLIEDYGHAMFDCGQWGPASERTWESVYGEAETLRVALLSYLTPRVGAAFAADTITRENN